MIDDDLDRVWNILGGPVRYFAKSHGRIQGGTCKTLGSLRRVVENLKNWDFYVTLNPSQGLGVKASSSDITHWRRILIDIDPVAPDASPSLAAGYTLGSLIKFLPNSATSFITTIDSGRGHQLWVEIEETLIQGRAHARRIEGAISSLYHSINHCVGGCRIDPSCSDLSRVARCPGTVNQKTGQLATILRRYSSWPLTGLPAKVILTAFPEETERPTKKLLKFSLKIGDLLPYLSQRAANYLTEGVGSPGRHSAAYAAAKSLQELGVAEENAEKMVQMGGRLCRPPLSETETLRATKNAYQKEKEIGDKFMSRYPNALKELSE
jgi:hypothetical protein